MARQGCEVIYVKVGRGDTLDIAIVEQTRNAIGPKRRLPLDPNEKWNPLTAKRMMHKLKKFDIEFIEQPTDCESLSALAQVRATSPIAIAADQRAFTPYDVFDICREKAADLIVLGLHETGGISRFCEAANIARAAGINVCIHGLYESGITTCAANQAAASVANLDDGCQYMNHLLEWDIVESPDLQSCLRFPLLMIITMRGDWAEFNHWQNPMGQVTEEVLKLMGVMCWRADRPQEVNKLIRGAGTMAFDGNSACAVILGQQLIGEKKWLD